MIELFDPIYVQIAHTTQYRCASPVSSGVCFDFFPPKKYFVYPFLKIAKILPRNGACTYRWNHQLVPAQMSLYKDRQTLFHFLHGCLLASLRTYVQTYYMFDAEPFLGDLDIFTQILCKLFFVFVFRGVGARL